jgi:hypothetical protein
MSGLHRLPYVKCKEVPTTHGFHCEVFLRKKMLIRPKELSQLIVTNVVGHLADFLLANA